MGGLALSDMVQVEDKARHFGRVNHTNGAFDLAISRIIASLGLKWCKSGLGWAADGGLGEGKVMRFTLCWEMEKVLRGGGGLVSDLGLK